MTLARRLAGPFADLPRAIWALFASNVVNYAGNFVWPLMTLLLTDRLGLSPKEASVYVSAAMLTWTPGIALGGRLADRFGRKRVFVVARVGASLLMLPCAALEPSLALIFLVLASRTVASIAEPAIGAMAADLATGQRRTAAVSLLYLGLNLGFAIGPLVAGLLYQRHLPWIFAGDALTTLASALMVLAWVPETLPAPDAAQVPEAERPVAGSLWSVLIARPQLFLLAATLLLLALAYSQTSFALPLQAMALLGELGPRAFGIAMAVNGITIVVATPLTARLRAGSATLVAIGAAFYALGFGSISFATDLPGLVGSTVIWSLGEVLVATHWRLYVAAISPSSHRARLQSTVQLAFGAGFVAGPVFAGRVIGRFGMAAVWPACFVVAALGTAIWASHLARLTDRR